MFLFAFFVCDPFIYVLVPKLLRAGGGGGRGGVTHSPETKHCFAPSIAGGLGPSCRCQFCFTCRCGIAFPMHPLGQLFATPPWPPSLPYRYVGHPSFLRTIKSRKHGRKEGLGLPSWAAYHNECLECLECLVPCREGLGRWRI